MAPLLALALLAAGSDLPPVQVQGSPAHAQIEGETDQFLFLQPGESLRMTARGPSRLVLDLRGYASSPVPTLAPRFAIHADGRPVEVPAIDKPANRRVDTPAGYASTATLVEIPLEAGEHTIELQVARGGVAALVSPEVAAPELDVPIIALPPRRKPPPTVAVEQQGPVDRFENPYGREPVALELMAGAATHLQLGGMAPLFGLGVDAQLGPDRRFGAGVGFDYLRLPIAVNADLGGGSQRLAGNLSSIPLLARASMRVLDGAVQPFIGLGAGLTIASLTLDGSGQATTALPTFEARVGTGVWAGPGEIVVQARLLASQGSFPGVAEHFQAGGLGAQAGYRFEL